MATITAVKGSVPREVGAKMVIHPFGKHVGTVGGGCGEAEVIRTGLDVIADGVPRVVNVDLTEEISMQSLGVCGGIMDVFVERWAPEEDAAGGSCTRLRSRLRRRPAADASRRRVLWSAACWTAWCRRWRRARRSRWSP